MKIFVLTIFPKMISDFCAYGMVQKAIKIKALEVFPVDLRKFDEKSQVDDKPFGGLPGMVIKPDVVFKAVRSLPENTHIILPQPWARHLEQKDLISFSKMQNLAIICGRYQGLDERVRKIATQELSLGNFVLSGGEIFAMTIIEGVARLLPDVLSEYRSLEEDSFNRWVGAPIYTRPAIFESMKVPEVLLSGNHGLIKLWILWQRIDRTLKYRPQDVPEKLSALESSIIEALKRGEEFESWFEVEGRRFLNARSADS
ncbi:MAG: tRNA (guanosine(37)-N1)-methyltransferase TrmD [Aquificaceae bacterium]